MIWLEFEEPSPWHSFNVLKESMLSVYQQVYPDLVVKKIQWDEFPEFADHETVVLADMRFDLVMWLKNLNPSISIHVHLYGNPLKRLKRLQNSEIEISQRVSFVVGSDVQKLTLQNVLNDPAQILTLPFTAPDEFHFDPVKRSAWREKYGLQDKKVSLYTGRISYQKNVHHLLKLFPDDQDKHLVIAGMVDNLNWREEPRAYYLNYTGEIFFEELQKKRNVTFLGKLDPKNLEEAYCGADQFVSLSTFDGEDFGLSLAEALTTGLPAFVTAWGGYKEFHSLPQMSFAKVEVQNRNLGMDLGQFLIQRESERDLNIKNYQSWNFPRREEAKKRLTEYSVKPFQGFTPAFHEYSLSAQQGEFFEYDQKFLFPYWV